MQHYIINNYIINILYYKYTDWHLWVGLSVVVDVSRHVLSQHWRDVGQSCRIPSLRSSRLSILAPHFKSVATLPCEML